MDAQRFDRLARSLIGGRTRRRLLGLGATGLLGALVWDESEGKKKSKNKKKCKKPCGPCKTCKKGKCKPRAAGTPCGEGQQCFANGECRACDVCLGDCSFTSLQDAVNAASLDTETTIRLCPGRYPTNAVIDKNVTLIGAGSDVGGTVLDGQQRGRVIDVSAFEEVTMRELSITGGSADQGAGIQTQFVTLMLEDVHLSDNHSSGNGGAMYVLRSSTTLSNCRISGNSAANGGGIYSAGVQGGFNTLRLRDHSIVTENASTATGGGNDGQGAGGIFNANSSYSTVEISEGSQVTGNTPVDCLGTTAC